MKKHDFPYKLLFALATVMLCAVMFGVSSFAMGSNIGDVNSDGKVNGKDATTFLKYSANWDVSINKKNADCNCDGDIKGNDVTALMRYLAYYDSDYINNENFVFVQKDPDKDFKMINFSDPQVVTDREYMDMYFTMNEIIKNEQPDLITVSGDISYGWNENYLTYQSIGSCIDGFGIPWSIVWGNHDNTEADIMKRIQDEYCDMENFVYHPTEGEMGMSNFVIVVREGFKPVEAIFMMDTHANAWFNGDLVWGKLKSIQIEWYEELVEILKNAGCMDSTLVTHIPIYAYNTALEAAVKDIDEYGKLALSEVDDSGIWNEGYEDSFGAFHEGYICSYPADDGVFAALKKHGSTKNVIAGHDHVNCFSIKYDGIRLTYSLKTGSGCYWEEEMNGGTVVMIDSNGVYDVHHHYVDLDKVDKTLYD